jgi:hypothetical protein
MEWAKRVYDLIGNPLQKIYQQHEHIAAPLFFFSGVTYDSLTITRIDRLFDNLILLTYLVVLGGLIVLVGWLQYDRVKNELLERYKHVYPWILQFFQFAEIAPQDW